MGGWLPCCSEAPRPRGQQEGLAWPQGGQRSVGGAQSSVLHGPVAGPAPTPRGRQPRLPALCVLTGRTRVSAACPQPLVQQGPAICTVRLTGGQCGALSMPGAVRQEGEGLEGTWLRGTGQSVQPASSDCRWGCERGAGHREWGAERGPGGAQEWRGFTPSEQAHTTSCAGRGPGEYKTAAVPPS